MSFKKFATSAAVITGLVATSLVPLTTAASARDGRHFSGGHSRHYDGGPRHVRGHDHYHGPRHRYVKRHRHNHGKDLATGLAIGLGVLAVGSIIAHSR